MLICILVYKLIFPYYIIYNNVIRVQQTPANARNSSYDFDIEDFEAKICDDPSKVFPYSGKF